MHVPLIDPRVDRLGSSPTVDQLARRSEALYPSLLDINEDAVQSVWIERPITEAIGRYLDDAVEMGSLWGRDWHWRTTWDQGDRLVLNGWPELPGKRAFADDVATLAGVLCDLLCRDHVKIRIDVTTQTTCPRFHVDNVVARLLCTYRGPGTECLDERHADRSKLGPGSGGLSDGQSGLILNLAGIHSIPTFAIAILKGLRWSGNPERGAIHRSPAVPPAKGSRVMVAIDAV